MPRKPADKSAAKKPSTRKKKEEVVEAVAETATVVDAPAKTPAPKKRGRKKAAPAENVVTEAPAKKTRDKKKAAPQAAEISEAAVAEEPLPGQLAFDGESTNTVADAPAPARKARKPRTKKAENKPTDDTPKKRGRKAKETGPVLTTTLQVGDKEYDISDLAAKRMPHTSLSTARALKISRLICNYPIHLHNFASAAEHNNPAAFALYITVADRCHHRTCQSYAVVDYPFFLPFSEAPRCLS